MDHTLLRLVDGWSSYALTSQKLHDGHYHDETQVHDAVLARHGEALVSLLYALDYDVVLEHDVCCVSGEHFGELQCGGLMLLFHGLHGVLGIEPQ